MRGAASFPSGRKPLAAPRRTHKTSKLRFTFPLADRWLSRRGAPARGLRQPWRRPQGEAHADHSNERDTLPKGLPLGRCCGWAHELHFPRSLPFSASLVGWTQARRRSQGLRKSRGIQFRRKCGRDDSSWDGMYGNAVPDWRRERERDAPRGERASSASSTYPARIPRTSGISKRGTHAANAGALSIPATDQSSS